MFAIVDTNTATVVPQKGEAPLVFFSLRRVVLPNGNVVFNPIVGYENPPKYGNDDAPPTEYKLYNVLVVEIGSGPSVVSTSDPVFDAQADTVTVTRTLQARPSRPNSVDQAEASMINEPFARAWVKRQARIEGKTPRQIMNEIRSDAQ